jgi:hypothetical protein
VPTNVGKTFESNLKSMLPCRGLATLFCLPESMRREAMSELRKMNVTAASLFPGLDGFARSLRSRVTLETLDELWSAARKRVQRRADLNER